MLNIACIKDEYPTEYRKSVAVCASRGGTCTAWRWGDQGHILTNHYCFSSQTQVDMASFDFLVEVTRCNDTSCDSGVCPSTLSLKEKNSVKFIESDEILDFALLQIQQDSVLKYNYSTAFGYLQIQKKAPSVRDEIYIPQHPLGGKKTIAMTMTTMARATRRSPLWTIIASMQAATGSRPTCSGTSLTRVEEARVASHLAQDPPRAQTAPQQWLRECRHTFGRTLRGSERTRVG